ADGRRGAEHWTALARSHPRRIRDALEQARAMSLAVYARRFGESVMGSNLRVLLGLAEAQFLLLVTLATELERVPTLPGAVEALRDLSRRYTEVRSVLVARAWRSPLENGPSPVPSSVADPAGLFLLLDRESAKSMLVVGALGQERPPQAAQQATSAPPTATL